MAFEVGRTYRTRGGDEVTIRFIDKAIHFPVRGDDGIRRTREGMCWRDGELSSRDLLPTPIDAPTDGEGISPPLPRVKVVCPTPPEPDTVWDRDAREFGAALVAKYGTDVSPQDAAIEAKAYADALAAIRAERGRAG